MDNFPELTITIQPQPLTVNDLDPAAYYTLPQLGRMLVGYYSLQTIWVDLRRNPALVRVRFRNVVGFSNRTSRAAWAIPGREAKRYIERRMTIWFDNFIWQVRDRQQHGQDKTDNASGLAER